MKGLIEEKSTVKAWWTLLPRFKFLFRKLWWVVVLTTASGLAISSWHSSKQPVVYVSTGRIMVSGRISIPGSAVFTEEMGNFSGTQMELMKSTEVRQRAATQVDSLHPRVSAPPVNLDVSQLRGTSLFVLTTTGDDPDYTRQFLQASMEEYINIRKEMRSEKSQTTFAALNDELGRIEKEIRSDEVEELAFQKQNYIGLQEEGNSAAIYLASLKRQLADLKTEFQLLNLLDLDQTLDRNQKKISDQGSRGASDLRDPSAANAELGIDYLQAKQEIEVLKIKRSDMSKVLRAKHPDIIQINEEIAHQESLIATFRDRTLDQLKSRRGSIGLQIENIEGMIKDWETKALDLSGRIAEYEKIKSKTDRAKGIREQLLTSLHSLDVNKNIEQDVVSILDPATPSEANRLGMVRGILLGLGLGFALGIGLLFVYSQLDDRFISYPEFQSYFPAAALTRVPTEKNTGVVPPIQRNDTRHTFVESFRSLHSSIHYLPIEGAQPKVLLVTSAIPNEGKSTVALNLAITLSFEGSKTLLIDADLRRGQLHDLFGMSSERGLSEVLREEVSLAEAIRPTDLNKLSFLPRGAILEHPGEQFLSEITDNFLKTIYRDYDYVVIDSPPVLFADDTSRLAPKADAVIFVVRFSYSSARSCNEGLSLLKSRGANVIGLVCNDVDPKYYNSYYHNSYYADYSDSSKIVKLPALCKGHSGSATGAG